MPENISEVSSNVQFKSDYLRYGIYILYRRVLSDYRDGLKPVQRRILWAMFKNSKAITTKVKSASVVGDVIRLYHPHSDSSIYGTMKPMANWFETYIPMIEPHGNFGTFQGDPMAASRYTECKLSKFAYENVIGDLVDSEEAVDWSPNYNEDAKEPDYLPVKVPLLLINGSFGIGLGMRADIPTHNLSEVIDATITLMHNPNAEITLVPDHCMKCEIIDTDFSKICRSGFGHYTIRGKVDIEDYKNKKALVIKSVPNLTFLDSITNKIEDLIKAKKIIQIEN